MKSSREKRIIHTSYCPEANMFVYANRNLPSFYRHDKLLGGVRCLKTGSTIIKAVKNHDEMMKTVSNTPTTMPSER